jgi:hypothetical protein
MWSQENQPLGPRPNPYELLAQTKNVGIRLNIRTTSSVVVNGLLNQLTAIPYSLFMGPLRKGDHVSDPIATTVCICHSIADWK